MLASLNFNLYAFYPQRKIKSKWYRQVHSKHTHTHSHPYKNSAWFWIEFQFELIWRYSSTTSRSHSHHQRFGFCFCASIPWHLFSLANTMFKRTKISFTLDWNGRALHWFHECSLFRERIVWVVYSIKGNAILTVLTLRSMSEPNAGCSRILDVCVSVNLRPRKKKR